LKVGVSMKVVLVADFGSSNVRIHAIDVSNGRIAAQHALKYPIVSTLPGFFEHHPEEVWGNSVQCMQHVYDEIASKAEICALSFSHIGSSLVVLDDNKEPLYPCILGMDSRAAKQGKELERRILAKGTMPDTSFSCADISPMAKAMWLMETHPDLANKAEYYVSIQQYILAKLGLPMVWDMTEAGSHSCFDVVERRWSHEVLDAAGIKASSLGSVVAAHEVIGEVDHYGSVAFHRKIPVVIGGHDAVMGAIGLGISDEKEDMVAEVTGSVDVYCFLMNSIFSFQPDQLVNMREGMVLMCEPGPLRNTTMVMSGYKTAGALIEWFLREMYGGSNEEAFCDLWANTVFDGRGKVRANPNFVNAGGSISGLDLSTTKYDVYRACIETLTFESRALLERCESLKKGACHRVRIGGGHANSPEWVQFRADVTGKTYERMENHEVSALGTAVLAAYGVGLYPSLGAAISSMVRTRDAFMPNPDIHACYDNLYQQYIRA
jgi:xylulokinase